MFIHSFGTHLLIYCCPIFIRSSVPLILFFSTVCRGGCSSIVLRLIGLLSIGSYILSPDGRYWGIHSCTRDGVAQRGDLTVRGPREIQYFPSTYPDSFNLTKVLSTEKWSSSQRMWYSNWRTLPRPKTRCSNCLPRWQSLKIRRFSFNFSRDWGDIFAYEVRCTEFYLIVVS